MTKNIKKLEQGLLNKLNDAFILNADAVNPKYAKASLSEEADDVAMLSSRFTESPSVRKSKNSK